MRRRPNRTIKRAARRSLTAILLIAGMVVAGPTPALGAQPLTELTGSPTCPHGKLVIDVWYFEKNLPDTGVLDQGWAIDADLANVRVWQTGGSTLCMLLSSPAGTFVTVAGPSPENTDPDGIAAGIRGVYRFAIRRTFTDRSLNAHPDLPRFGWLGTMDGGWDGQQQSIDDAAFFRPDLVYFEPGPPSVVDGYHYVYRSFGHGTWVEDFASGDLGDITD